MKKVFIYFAAALCLAACTQESPVIEEDSNSLEPQYVTVSFSVTTENDSDQEVKALIDQVGGTIAWNDGDQIAIHTDKGNLAVLTYRTSHGKFTGSIAADDSVSDDCIAYYPASIAASGNDSKVSLPNSYTSIQEAAKSFPLRGTVSGSSITLKHLGGVIRITLNNAPESLDKVVLTMPKNITGDFTVADDSGNKVINAGASSDDVTINVPSSSRIGDDLVLLVPVPVGSYDGFNVEFYEGSTKLFEKGTANTITMARKQFRKMAAFNTPEGDVSTEWRIYRSYSGSWDVGANNYVSLKEMIGHPNWLAARNVIIDENGFRFSNYDGSAWSKTNWGGSRTESLHTRYATSSTTASRIRTGNAGTYDIYFNSSTYEFFLANAGDPWYRYVYILPDKAAELSTIYWLHSWGADSEGDVTKWYGCMNSGIKTVNGAQYLVFRFDPYKYQTYSEAEAYKNQNYLPNYTLNFILYNESAVQLYRIENSLSPVAGTNVFGYQVSARSDARGQFTNIEDPQKASGYRVLLVDDDAHSIQTQSEYFTWTSEGLIAKNVSLSSTNIGFIITYNGSWSSPACGFDNTKAAEYFDLKGSDSIELSNVKDVGFTHFRFNTAQLPTTVDIKLDIYNKRVWILPHEL